MGFATNTDKPLIYKTFSSINSHHSAILEITTDGLIFRHRSKLMDLDPSSSRPSFSLFFLVNKEIEKKRRENRKKRKDVQNNQTDGKGTPTDGKGTPTDGNKAFNNQTLNKYSRLNPSIHAAAYPYLLA